MRRRLSYLPIRLKITLPLMAAIAVMLAAVLLYFPWKHGRSLMMSYRVDAKRTTQLVSFAVSYALKYHDFEHLQETLRATQINPNVLYIVLLDERSDTLGVFNPQARRTGLAPESEFIEVRKGIVDSEGKQLGELALGYSLRALARERLEHRIATFGFTLVSFLLGLLIIQLVSRRLLRPISTLDSQMNAIISRGSFLTEVDVGSSDEIGRLAGSFNRMVTELKRRHDQLEDSERKYRALYESAPDVYFSLDREGIIVDANAAAVALTRCTREELLNTPLHMFLRNTEESRVDEVMERVVANEEVHDSQIRLKPRRGKSRHMLLTSRRIAARATEIRNDGRADRPYTLVALSDITRVKQYEKELLKANLQLRQLDSLKSNFVSDVSHHLRTPLTIMRGEVEVTLRRKRTAKEYREALDILQDEIRSLVKIVANLLTLARADAGNLIASPQPIDLAQICHQQVREAEALSKQKRISLVCSIEDECEIRGDSDRLAELVFNLIENAIKYSPEGGHVDIQLRTLDGEAILRVADQGMGMSSDDLERVFDRFFRGAKVDMILEGTGLGLAICKSIAEAHGGRITAESRLGKGSTFEVRLLRSLTQGQAKKSVSVLDPAC